MANVDMTASSSTVTSHNLIIRADSAAEFVLKHAESFGTSIEGLGYEGQYEVLVGFAGLSQRVIILLSDELPRSARKTAKKLRWITAHFQCTIYTPSWALVLYRDKSWAQYGEPGTKKPSLFRKYVRYRSSTSVTDTVQHPPEAPGTERSGALSSITKVSSSGHSLCHNSDGGEGGGCGDSISSSSNSSHTLDGEEGGSGGEPIPSRYLIKGRPDKMRIVTLRGRSTINGRSGDDAEMMPLSLGFYFDIGIQSCENAEAKPYWAEGRAWEFDRAWTEVNIHEFVFTVDNPEVCLATSTAAASHHLQVFRLFVGSTPLEAYPISYSSHLDMSKLLRVGTGRAKEVERDCWMHASLHDVDEFHNRLLACDVYKQRGIYSMADTTVRSRPGPVTIIDYRNVRLSDEEKSIFFAMESFYSSLPVIGRGLRSWLNDHFNNDREKMKTHLHADLSHRFDLELHLANIPVGRPNEIDIAEPLIEEVDISAFHSGRSQQWGREVSPQKMASTIPFQQSIGGTISQRKTSCIRSIGEKIIKPLDRLSLHSHK